MTTLDEALNEELKNPDFRAEWDATEDKFAVTSFDDVITDKCFDNKALDEITPYLMFH